MKEQKLYRSCTNRILGGVAGGLGEYFEIDPVIIRLIFVILVIAAGSGFLIYFLAWIIIPENPKCSKHQDAKEEIKEAAENVANEIKKNVKYRDNNNSKSLLGLIILAVGGLLLVQNLIGLNFWHNFWPVILIVLGLGIILQGTRSKEDK